MSEETKSKRKRYYFIQLKEESFQTRITTRIQRERNAGNAMYLYIRLLTRAVKFKGELFDEYGEPFEREDVYLLASLSEEEGARALETIERAGGIIETEDGILYMPEWEGYVVSIDESTPRQRKRRARIAEEKKAEKEQSTTTEEVTRGEDPDAQEPAQEPEARRDPDAQELDQGRELGTPEEANQEPEDAKILDLTGKPHKEQEKPGDIVARVVAYLNNKAGRTFKPTTKATQGHIKNRLREGFEEEDFYKVIDNRVAEWTNDPKMNQYLRPETLFGPKFEGYLQTAIETNAGMWAERTGEEVNFDTFDAAMMNGGVNA